MGINNSPRIYLWWWLDWGWIGCVRPRAHGKHSDGLRWRDRISGAGKAMLVKMGCTWGRGDQGEDTVPRNWMEVDDARLIWWMSSFGLKVTDDGKSSNWGSTRYGCSSGRAWHVAKFPIES